MSVQIIFLDCLLFEDRRIGVDWENSERIVSMSGFLNYQTMGGNDGATGATLATYCNIVLGVSEETEQYTLCRNTIFELLLVNHQVAHQNFLRFTFKLRFLRNKGAAIRHPILQQD
ncbi:hypothetical protein B0H10DRAFT_1949357 [Mycena sp. CBHHK59/15]|nr:hypothetical protein B0H10DRAFT_1949357 [Mycena sp. CBHHK59/15]